MIPRKADVEMTIAKYGSDFLTAVVSAIGADDGEPLKLAKSSFKAMAVQKPNGWSTSDKLTVGVVYKPTPGIHVFAPTGFSNGVPPGPYAIAVTVIGAWQGQNRALATPAKSRKRLAISQSPDDGRASSQSPRSARAGRMVCAHRPVGRDACCSAPFRAARKTFSASYRTA